MFVIYIKLFLLVCAVSKWDIWKNHVSVWFFKQRCHSEVFFLCRSSWWKQIYPFPLKWLDPSVLTHFTSAAQNKPRGGKSNRTSGPWWPRRLRAAPAGVLLSRRRAGVESDHSHRRPNRSEYVISGSSTSVWWIFMIFLIRWLSSQLAATESYLLVALRVCVCECECARVCMCVRVR